MNETHEPPPSHLTSPNGGALTPASTAASEALAEAVSVVTAAQVVELGRAVLDLVRPFVEVPDERSTEASCWRALRRTLVDVGTFVGQFLIVAGRLQAQRPDNWPTALGYATFRAVIEDGFPVLWVPEASILDTLTKTPSRRARQQVLLDHRDQIVTHARHVLAEVTAPDLATDRHHLEQALECVANQPAPAQALALNLAVIRAQTEVGAKSLKALSLKGQAEARRGLVVGVEDVGVSLMLTAVAPALEHFYPSRSDPVPARPNRHAVAHVTSAEQYTPGNALESVLLAVSVLRQAQASRAHRASLEA